MNLSRKQWGLIVSAGLVFAIIFGIRQSQALFISSLNTKTGLGIAAISLAFACAQLMWGITQPIAGAIADKYGTGRVIAIGAVLVTVGTVLTPYANTTWMLVLLIGVIAAFEAASKYRSLTDQVIDIVAIVVCIGTGLWSVRRYLYLLMHAELVANQAHCPACTTYARFQLVRTDALEEQASVCCRNCGHEWTING